MIFLNTNNLTSYLKSLLISFSILAIFLISLIKYGLKNRRKLNKRKREQISIFSSKGKREEKQNELFN